MARAMGVTAVANKPVLQFVDVLARAGAETLVVELACRLDPERFRPAVACFRQDDFHEELQAAGRTVHVVPKRRPFDLRLLLGIARLVRREGFALVHTHDIQSATYTSLAARLVRVAVVLTVHGLGFLRQKRAPKLLPRLARWLDRVVFVGHWLERVAAAEFGFEPLRPTVIHNGVDVERFHPGPADPGLRAALGIPEGAPVVGTVGNLRPVKDYPTLLRAFATALRRVPEAVLVFVGDGEERAVLEALASDLGITGSVRFAGARRDVPALLRCFDLFALSSVTEGISVALCEAMASGLPAVATDTGGNPEVVAPGETGALVPVGDHEAMGHAVADLLADPERRRAWGQAARQRAVEEFSLDRMVRAYERLYDEVLGER